MEAGKEIELRSEEVQEVMGQIPAWIVRWGITILFIVVLALLVGSYFFISGCDHDGDDIDKPASGGRGGDSLVRKDK